MDRLELVVCQRHDDERIEAVVAVDESFPCLTQQVDGRDAEEIHEWFGEDFLYPNVTSRHYTEALDVAGLSVDVVDDWSGTMEFADAEALVTYLALVPWDAPHFTVDAHVKRLAALDANRPIRVTQRRFRVYATKPRV